MQPISQIAAPQTQASADDLDSLGRSSTSVYSQRWRNAVLLLIICFVLVAVLFRQTIAGMISLWQYGAYSHGYLIFPVSAFLIWKRREVLFRVEPRVSFLAVLAVAGISFVWLVGELADANLIRELAVVALVPTLVCAVLGVNVARALLFPLGFLFFAVPAGSSLIPMLQDITAWFTVSGLHLTGIPAVLEGRRIYISSGVWEVAEACSGLRYLISSLALGTLFAYVVYRSWIRRALFVAASIVVPIVANGLRAFSIVVLAHKVNPDLALGVDHLIYGWIFFAFVILLLFMGGFRWHEKPLEENPSPIQVTEQQPSPTAFSAQWSRLVITVTAILIMITASIAADRLQKRSPTLGFSSLPGTASPWKPARSTAGDNWLKVSTGDVTKTAVFTDGEHDVKLAIILYGSQAAQRHLGDSLQEQLAGAGWNEVEGRQHKTTVNHRPLSVAENTFTNGSRHRVSWSWYWVDDQLTPSSSRAKLLRAKAVLLGTSSLTARIVLVTEADSAVGGSAVLNDFLQHCELLKVRESSSSMNNANGPTR